MESIFVVSAKLKRNPGSQFPFTFLFRSRQKGNSAFPCFFAHTVMIAKGCTLTFGVVAMVPIEKRFWQGRVISLIWQHGVEALTERLYFSDLLNGSSLTKFENLSTMHWKSTRPSCLNKVKYAYCSESRLRITFISFKKPSTPFLPHEFGQSLVSATFPPKANS